ncbi:MAG TPA: endonuclease domain-containing protein [Caulobacteraceae bacterium]
MIELSRRERQSKGAIKRSRRLRREMTLPEQALWRVLRRLGLNVRRQAPIGRYIADFAIHEAGLVIEIDGGRHDLPEAQLHDAIRDQWLQSQGYCVLRFRNRQVLDEVEGVVEAILAPLPPRWGKGRDGGGGSALSGVAMEAAPPPTLFQTPAAATPTQPSPIEGEGS